MIVISMLMFARLMQRLGDLQIGNVLHLVGIRGGTSSATCSGGWTMRAVAARAPKAQRATSGSAARPRR